MSISHGSQESEQRTVRQPLRTQNPEYQGAIPEEAVLRSVL